jgi:two-component system alkaline phosphatase synthesis response regulator PhoP
MIPMRIGDILVRLTRKEHDLLVLLAQNTGRLLSRRFLLEAVWGYNARVITRTLDVHIMKLRQKLAAQQDLQIHTVLGMGYVLERSVSRDANSEYEASFKDRRPGGSINDLDSLASTTVL